MSIDGIELRQAARGQRVYCKKFVFHVESRYDRQLSANLIPHEEYAPITTVMYFFSVATCAFSAGL